MKLAFCRVLPVFTLSLEQRPSAEIIDPYMKLRAYLLMLFVVAVWGSTFVLIKSALAHATPAAFNLARMTLAFAVMAVAYHRYWRGIRVWQIWAGAIVGLCLAAGYQFQTIGLVSTTPSKSAFITGLVVVLVPLFSSIPGVRPPGPGLRAGMHSQVRRLPSWEFFFSPRRPRRLQQLAPILPQACFPTCLHSTSATCSPSAAPSDSHFIALRSAMSPPASPFNRWRCFRSASAQYSCC